MSEARLEIRTWGNSLGVRIPSAVARAARLRANQPVKLSVEGNRVIITPEAPKPPSLAERLALYDPARHGGEAMAASLIGAEKL